MVKKKKKKAACECISRTKQTFTIRFLLLLLLLPSSRQSKLKSEVATINICSTLVTRFYVCDLIDDGFV